jgi:hypothetical protein
MAQWVFVGDSQTKGDDIEIREHRECGQNQEKPHSRGATHGGERGPDHDVGERARHDPIPPGLPDPSSASTAPFAPDRGLSHGGRSHPRRISSTRAKVPIDPIQGASQPSKRLQAPKLQPGINDRIETPPETR